MLVLGAVVGLVNGSLVTLVGIPSFIVTLGTMSILRGAALVLANGWPVSDLPYSSFFDIFGGRAFDIIPMQSVWMVVVLLIGGFVLARTKFGYHVYATGGNPRAARLMGIDTRRVRIINFMISGVLAAFGGMISLAFLKPRRRPQASDWNLTSYRRSLSEAPHWPGVPGPSSEHSSAQRSWRPFAMASCCLACLPTTSKR